MPRASSGSFKPEPMLDANDYEDILQTVTDVISIVNRSPSIARQMKIDNLRNYIMIGTK